MDWPILLIWPDAQTDPELIKTLNSKGWAVESVGSLGAAQRKCTCSDYLAIVIKPPATLDREEIETLFQIRKIQPLAPIFVLSPQELNILALLEALDLDSRVWCKSSVQLHQALSDVLQFECDQSLAQTVILCVDDDPEFLLSMRQWLEPRLAEHFAGRGLPQMEFAMAPDQALEFIDQIYNSEADSVSDDSPSAQYAQATHLGLVITDQKMPKMTGTELLGRVKALAPKARRALLTGYAGLDSAVTAINEQLVDRYFTKPITDHVDFANGIVHLLNEFLLSERQHWYLQRLRAQYEFARELSVRSSLEEVLELTVSFVAENLQCQRISLMLIEDANLIVKAHRGLPDDLDLSNLRIPLGERVAGAVVQTRLPTYQNDRDLAYANADDSPIESSFRIFASVPLMLVPLRMHDIPLGVINVTERLDDKPFTRDEAALLSYIADTVSIAIRNQLNLREVQDLYYQTIASLAATVESKDPYTHGHSRRVHDYAVGIARQMNLTPDQVELIGRAALLHDLGKISVPDHIVDKPGPLTEEEFKPMAEHPAEGARIIETLNFLRPLSPIVCSHHERLDGTGYPDGLEAQDIPLASRIIAVADTADAMTSSRPYREARSEQQMIDELHRVSGAQLDPDCVKAFLHFWSLRRTTLETPARPLSPAPSPQGRLG